MKEYICGIKKEDMYLQQYGEIKQRLIRCKDCKWAVTIGCGWYVCRMLVSGKHLGEWFCADGKAKDGEQE